MELYTKISESGTIKEIANSLVSIIASLYEGLMEIKTSPICWEDKTLITEIHA